jgi:hypothetical protein
MKDAIQQNEIKNGSVASIGFWKSSKVFDKGKTINFEKR